MSRRTSSGPAQRAAWACARNDGTAAAGFRELTRRNPSYDPPPRGGKPPKLNLPGLADRPDFKGNTSAP